MRLEQPELYKEIESNLNHVARQSGNVAAVIQKLKAIRLKRRFTLEEIAAKTSITRQSLRLLENSPLANPEVHTLQRYALALGHELKIKVIQKKKRRKREERVKEEGRKKEGIKSEGKQISRELVKIGR
jgi:transcriptional regulator with XRE-family HTH domain